METIDAGLLDPGIRHVVLYLRFIGFETTDSGDGMSKPPEARTMGCPHVYATVPLDDMIAEAQRLARVLNGWRVEASYCPNDGSAILLAYLIPA